MDYKVGDIVVVVSDGYMTNEPQMMRLVTGKVEGFGGFGGKAPIVSGQVRSSHMVFKTKRKAIEWLVERKQDQIACDKREMEFDEKDLADMQAILAGCIDEPMTLEQENEALKAEVERLRAAAKNIITVVDEYTRDDLSDAMRDAAWKLEQSLKKDGHAE